MELWETIESRFSQSSPTHSIQLRVKLQSLKLGSGTVSTFLSQIKKVTDELYAAGSRIADDELVVIILNGLDQIIVLSVLPLEFVILLLLLRNYTIFS